MVENKSIQRPVPGVGTGGESPSDWQRALMYIQQNPKAVIAGAVFLVVCIVLGALVSLYNMSRDREVMTEYAAALNAEDPAARATALAEVAQGDNRWQVETLYLSGEAALTAGSHDKAREAFQEVVDEHPDSRFAAAAAEGLAFLEENAGNLQEALAGYTAVFETYDDSFVGRRQPSNIARIQEALGNLPEAIAAYEKQVEVFPNSSVASRASAALARLNSEHPELFPEDATADAVDPHAGHDHAETVPAEAAPVEDAPVEDAPAEETPVEEAPVEAAPVEEAPVDAAPLEEAPVEEAPVEEAPTEAAPADAVEAPADNG